jgi:hypothetical protein
MLRVDKNGKTLVSTSLGLNGFDGSTKYRNMGQAQKRAREQRSATKAHSCILY